MNQEKEGISLVPHALITLTRASGQAVVEFTLMFLLFLIIAWIPADFGLAVLGRH